MPDSAPTRDRGLERFRDYLRILAAARQRSAPRRDAASARAAFPAAWELDLQRPLRGTVIFLRRTNEQGEVELLGRRFRVDPLRRIFLSNGRRK